MQYRAVVGALTILCAVLSALTILSPRHYNRMRKLLIMLLLTWLPAQITWAAVSVYCQHESALEAKQDAHPGHHEHQHADVPAQLAQSSQPATPPAQKQPGAKHPDCSVCHVTAAVPTAPATMAAPNVQAASVSILRTASPAPPPALPERPNWPPA